MGSAFDISVYWEGNLQTKVAFVGIFVAIFTVENELFLIQKEKFKEFLERDFLIFSTQDYWVQSGISSNLVFDMKIYFKCGFLREEKLYFSPIIKIQAVENPSESSIFSYTLQTTFTNGIIFGI